MRSGIYALIFNDCDKLYVGQSINIDKRYKEHLYALTRGDCNKKLLEAFKAYGTPELFILEESAVNLDELELQYISKLNTVDSGLNEWYGPVKVLRGQNHPNSKYSDTQILEVIYLLTCDIIIPFLEISVKTGVSRYTVENISSGKVGAHLKTSIPEKYKILEARRGSRISEASSAKGRGITYPIILSPSGEEYNIENITKFAKEHDLNKSHLCGVLNRVRKSHKGWRLK